MFKYVRHIILYLIIIQVVISCNNSPKNHKFESILILEDTLHPVFIPKNDSLIFYESLHEFFKDSCIVYGKIGIQYLVLGEPHTEYSKPAMRRNEFVRNKIFKIEFSPYRSDKKFKTIILDKKGDYRYHIKLKKQKSYQIKFYEKKVGEEEFKQVKNSFMHLDFKTFDRDVGKFDVKFPVWTT